MKTPSKPLPPNIVAFVEEMKKYRGIPSRFDVDMVAYCDVLKELDAKSDNPCFTNEDFEYIKAQLRENAKRFI